MVLLRISAFFMSIPIFFPKSTPAMVKVGFCVVFTFLILPGVNYENVNLITNNTALIIFCYSRGYYWFNTRLHNKVLFFLSTNGWAAYGFPSWIFHDEYV